MRLKAIISGGGIGGLATAAALAKRDWDVTVFESRPEVRVSGSGIYLRSNGLSVLREIGAYERATRGAFWPAGVEKREYDGTVVSPAPEGESRKVVCVARSELISALEEAARSAGARIETGREVVGARANGTLLFADGHSVRADLAVGCDGVWSPVRRSLNLEDHTLRPGEGALRAMIPCTQEELPEDARGKCIELWQGTRRMLITPVNDREIYLALTCKEWDEEARDVRVRPCWMQTFPEWAWLLERIAGRPVLWNVYSVIRSKTWSAGKVAILGDAAHAQPPNLGQGGGTAMYNGLALAAYMAQVDDTRDVPEALEAWEAAVRPLTDRTQHWSTLYLELTNIPNEYRTPIAAAVFKSPWVLENITAAANSVPIARVDWRPVGGNSQK